MLIKPQKSIIPDNMVEYVLGKPTQPTMQAGDKVVTTSAEAINTVFTELHSLDQHLESFENFKSARGDTKDIEVSRAARQLMHDTINVIAAHSHFIANEEADVKTGVPSESKLTCSPP